MAKSDQLFSSVRKALDTNEINYEIAESKTGLILRGIPLDCKLKEFNCLIETTDYYCTAYAYIPLRADEDCRMKVAEFVTRANYGLRAGKFELDFEDGEVRYAISIDCDDRASLSDDLVMSTMLGTPYRMINRYGDALVAVMYGIKSPEEAIKEAESN